jgi:hypothetical protein
MSSVTRFTAQIPLGGSHLVAFGTTGDFTHEVTVTGLTVGTGGVVSINGSVVTFDTVANAVSALGDSAGTALAVGQLFEDLGKNLYVYYLNNGVATRFAVLTKVRRIINGASSDGANGNVGYVCTWVANPTSSAVGTFISVNVARVSYQNGGV